MKKIAFLLFGIIMTTIAVNAQQDSTLNQFTGKYIFPAGSAVQDATVTLEGGSLFIVSAIGSATLSRVAKDTFSIVEYNGTAEFKRNEDGKITGIHVRVADIDIVGTKEETAMYWHRSYLMFKL